MSIMFIAWALNRVLLSITWLFSNQQITWSQVTFYHTSSTHCSLKSFYFLICIKIKLIFNGFPGQELDFWRFSAEASLIHNVSVWNPKRSSRDQEWIRESEQLVIVISCYYRCRQDKASQGGEIRLLFTSSLMKKTCQFSLTWKIAFLGGRNHSGQY